MAQYKKGIITNESIISTAKKAFKEEGFKNTTIASICKKCNIKLGTFTYYFNKKEDLLNHIYTDYMNQCRAFISSKKLNLSRSEKHIYTVAMYYYNMYSHQQILDFHKEVLSITSMNGVFSSPREMIEDFAIDGHIPEDDHQYDLLVKADNAYRREFNLMYVNTPHQSIDEVKELLESIYYLASKIFEIDTEHTYKVVNEAFTFVKENGDRNITLL